VGKGGRGGRPGIVYWPGLNKRWGEGDMGGPARLVHSRGPHNARGHRDGGPHGGFLFF